MTNAKIELTDKQIMRTELEAERELSAQLTDENNKLLKYYEQLKEEKYQLMEENYQLKKVLKSVL